MNETIKKYKDVVKAYLDGEQVQFAYEDCLSDLWTDTEEPSWSKGVRYRIKPKEPVIVHKYIPVGCSNSAFHHTGSVYSEENWQPVTPIESIYSIVANIKIACDADTGEILSCELVK